MVQSNPMRFRYKSDIIYSADLLLAVWTVARAAIFKRAVTVSRCAAVTPDASLRIRNARDGMGKLKAL